MWSIWKVCCLSQPLWVAGLLIFSSLRVHMCVCARGRCGSMRKRVKNFLQDLEAKFVCKRQMEAEKHTHGHRYPQNPQILKSLSKHSPDSAFPLTHCVFLCRVNTSGSFTSGKKVRFRHFPACGCSSAADVSFPILSGDT